jgi:hypothetical protein
LILEILGELEGMLLFLAELESHPFLGSEVALVVGVVGHRQIQEGGKEFAVDLRVDFLRHFLADHDRGPFVIFYKGAGRPEGHAFDWANSTTKGEKGQKGRYAELFCKS